MREYEIIETRIGEYSILKGANQTDALAFVISEAREMLLITRQSGVYRSEALFRFRFLGNGRHYAPVSSLGKTDEDLETLRQMLGHEDLDTTSIYSVMYTAEALERMARKPVKFHNEGEGFKSSKPWTDANGLAGILTPGLFHAKEAIYL